MDNGSALSQVHDKDLIKNNFRRFGLAVVSIAFVAMAYGLASAQMSKDGSLPIAQIVPKPEDGHTGDSGVDGEGGGALAMLPAIFADDPQEKCLQGRGLFAATPKGFFIIFPEPRDRLPFDVEERPSVSGRNVALIFSTPTCRVTITVTRDVLEDNLWLPQMPADK